MFGTRFWDAGGTAGVDDAFAGRNSHGIGAEIMGANKFGPPGWGDDPDWRAGGARTRHFTHRPQVPIVLGRGVRIWDGLEALEDAYDVEAVSSPAASPTSPSRGRSSRERTPPQRGGADSVNCDRAPRTR